MRTSPLLLLLAFCFLSSWPLAYSADGAKTPPGTEPPDDQPVVERAKAQKNGDDYMKELSSRISSKWMQPKVAKRMDVTVSFTIDKTGKVKRISVKKTSGDKVVDQAALSAVQRAQPFGAFPGDYSEQIIEYTLTCVPGKGVDDYKFNGVPLNKEGYRISDGGATLRPLDTSSSAERLLQQRSAALEDKVISLDNKVSSLEKTKGPDDPELIPTLRDLASAHKQLQHWDDADEVYKRVVAMEEKAGKKAELAATLFDYADMYYTSAKLEQAEPLFARAVALKKEIGLSGPADEAMLEEYAKLLYKVNRASEADSIYQQIKALRAH